MTTYRAFPGTDGPSSVTATSGSWLLGVLFSTLGQMSWFDGYWIWNPSNGDTTPRKCALWNIYAIGTQEVVSGSVVTSGTLTQGAWNYVALPTPVQLAPGALYCAATGWSATAGIPLTGGQFGSSGAYSGGISNGPLQVWSAVTEFPAANPNYQYGAQLFSNALGSDPSVAMPNNSSGSDNFWIDVQLDSSPPSGYAGSYRLWPNTADLGNYSDDTANNFTLGMEFSLSETCAIDNIWFYSPSGVTQLPTEIGVYRVSTTTLAASNASPSWSGAAGSGWIKASLSGTLQPGVNYKAVVLNGAGTAAVWNAAVADYWSTGFGSAGLTSGPITAPDSSGASPGQESYNLGASIAYPGTVAGPYRYGVDIELTPAAASLSGLLMASII